MVGSKKNFGGEGFKYGNISPFVSRGKGIFFSVIRIVFIK